MALRPYKKSTYLDELALCREKLSRKIEEFNRLIELCESDPKLRKNLRDYLSQYSKLRMEMKNEEDKENE